MPLSPLSSSIRSTIRRSPVSWARACHITLRPYQVEIARAVKDSILHHKGYTFVVILPRQSGKNELQAHLFSWLLFRYAAVGGRIVSVSPTFKPQTLNNMDRVALSLNACLGSRSLWKSSKGYVYALGKARLQFFSGEPHAKVVGATADLLLSVDEAQEVSILKFDKDFDPMTASTNATRIFWGIPWLPDTLLDRELRFALHAEQQDGVRRLFRYTADDVRFLVPAYDLHLRRVIAEHGRDHPRVLSQYFCITLEQHSCMFNPARLALLIAPPAAVPPSPDNAFPSGEGDQGGEEIAAARPRLAGVKPPSSVVQDPSSMDRGPSSVVHGQSSAFLIDVAGQDERAGQHLAATAPADDMSHRRDVELLSNPSRDSTALSIVRIDLSTLQDLGHPTYHVVERHVWVGENHLLIFGKLKNLAEKWNPQHIIIDATGVGEGLWSLLDRAFPSRVIPVKFTLQEKSDLGWRFLSVIETGRFRDHAHTDEVRLQYTHCLADVLPGPQKTLRWGVPEGVRGPDGALIHDDYIMADALVARLDLLQWSLSTEPAIVRMPDPLEQIDRAGRSHASDRFFDPVDYDHSFGYDGWRRSF